MHFTDFTILNEFSKLFLSKSRNQTRKAPQNLKYKFIKSQLRGINVLKFQNDKTKPKLETGDEK